jgi:outer membrane protein insertion porin family
MCPHEMRLPGLAGSFSTMKTVCGLLLLVFCLTPAAFAQFGNQRVASIKVEHVGPQTVSDQLIRSHIRVKQGDPYLRSAVDDDVRGLYATGLFFNIRVAEESSRDGVVLTYIVQGNPRLTEINFEGNRKLSDARLRKRATSKVGQPFSERKLFTDTQEFRKMYQKAGQPRTEVRYRYTIDEAAGRATATFEVDETPKVRIVQVEFVGAEAFSQRRLRKVVKTRRHWMFSWLTGGGYLKDEQLEDDRERLAAFYRDNGYIDFELKNVTTEMVSARKMLLRFHIFEGRQYRVGSVDFEGNELFSDSEITNGLRVVSSMRRSRSTGPHGLPMDVGDVFSPKGLSQSTETVEDFYGSKGHIDVVAGRDLTVKKIPNTQTGTIDLEFQVEEGQKSFIERIEIRGNTKTKDRVIRRELAVSPGETFDMTRVKLSKQRLEGLQYFEKVDTRPEPTDISPLRKNLIVSVEEKNTGNLTMGAGFSSVDAVVGFAEISQGNFDLFHPPTFTGGGQKFRLRVQVGTRRQDYVVSFIEPWFLNRKLALGVDLYYRNLGYESLGNIYDVVRAGGRVSLTRALGSEYLIGSVSYTIENLGILLNDGFYGPYAGSQAGPGRFGDRGGPAGPPPGPTARNFIGNVPPSIAAEEGYSLLSRFGSSIAYDTRNSVTLPNRGQRTELGAEFVTGDREFYKLDLKTSWYYRGLARGHVLELVGRAGVAEGIGSENVPFYDRYYLGGLYSLRGFRYRSISPRETPFREPVGGNTFWYGSAEYSIPIIERLRLAAFYDAGVVAADAYDFTDMDLFNDNWGIGLRLNLPIGPIRLDYGVPINHDRYNDGKGRFQFGVGYTRDF